MGISLKKKAKKMPKSFKKKNWLFHNSLLPENVTIVLGFFPKSSLDHVAWEFHL